MTPATGPRSVKLSGCPGPADQDLDHRHVAPYLGEIACGLPTKKRAYLPGDSPMDRRTFLSVGAAGGCAILFAARRALARSARADFPKPEPLPFRDEKSKLKITAIRAVRLVPKRPPPKYQPAPGSWNTTDVEIA